MNVSFLCFFSFGENLGTLRLGEWCIHILNRVSEKAPPEYVQETEEDGRF
jgi:hypothetical protein